MPHPNANDPRQTADHDPNAPIPGTAHTADFAPASSPAGGTTATYMAGQGTAPKCTEPERGPGKVSVPGYEIEGVLGRGGMGVVYKARHLALKRTVALKMVLAREHAGPGERARFRIEAEAVARLSHPNIVQIHEVGEADGHPYCALEFVEGGNLASKILGKPMPARQAAKLVEALARAMQLAHSRNVVHRDLKPANILLSPLPTGGEGSGVSGFGTPKITDFGLARQLDSDSGETQAGAVMGTPSYMAPEQASGRAHEAGPAADVYALGAILYACLTGRPPFKGKTVVETLDQVRTQEPVPPSRWQARVPPDLETICLKCLAKEPEKRYASAAEFADELVRYQQGEPILARPVGRLERTAKWVKRNKVVSAAAVAVVLALAVGTTVSYVKYRETEEALGKADDALGKEAERVKERDYQLGISDFLLAVAAYENGNVKLAAERLEKVPKDQRGWEWGYLKRQVEGGLFTLHGHKASVTSASFSSDGARIVTGGGELGKPPAPPTGAGEAKVWDARTGALLLDLKGHTGKVNSVHFSPDGTRIVTGSAYTAKVWDARTGAPLLDLKGHKSLVYDVRFSPDGARIVTSSFDHTAKVWDARTGAPLLDLTGHKDIVWSVSFSPDGARIVTGSDDTTAKVWDARTGVPLLVLKGHTGGIRSVSFSPDGARVITGSGDTAKVWDAGTGTPLLELKGHKILVFSASFSPDGTRIVTGSFDHTAKVWDARTGTPLLELKGHTSDVSSVSFSPDGAHILTGSHDQTAKVWDARTGMPRLDLTGHTAAVRSGSFSRDGRRIATNSGDTARIWDARTGMPLLDLKGHKGPVESVSFSPDGTRLVSGGFDNMAKVWDAHTGAPLLDLKGHIRNVNSVSFSNDGARILTASNDQRAKVWDAHTGTPLLDLWGWHTSQVTSACLSADGARIVTGSWDKTAKVWDAHTGAPLLDLKGHTGMVMSVSISRDGTRIVTGSEDRTAKVWNARTGTHLLDLKGHTAAVLGATFSPDGRRIVTSSEDQTAKVWDARTGTPLLDLKGHTGWVLSVSFSLDGARIVTGSMDKTAKVWDARIGHDLNGDQPLDADELAYRLYHTRPNERHYSEEYDAARKANDRFAARFYLDRLLSMSTQRTTARFQERSNFQPDPVLVARTSFHHPALAKTPYDRGTVALLAADGGRLAQRLVAQELLRDGKPGPAIPLLFWCMASRPATSPPVEELLLTQAYLDLKQPGEARRFYRAATEWLDRPRNPNEGFGAAFEPLDDPRRNPFDWEVWHECDVFRAAVERPGLRWSRVLLGEETPGPSG